MTLLTDETQDLRFLPKYCLLLLPFLNQNLNGLMHIYFLILVRMKS